MHPALRWGKDHFLQKNIPHFPLFFTKRPYFLPLTRHCSLFLQKNTPHFISCLRVCVVVGFQQFCTTFPHISASCLVFIRVGIFFKCRIKLACLIKFTEHQKVMLQRLAVRTGDDAPPRWTAYVNSAWLRQSTSLHVIDDYLAGARELLTHTDPRPNAIR